MKKCTIMAAIMLAISIMSLSGCAGNQQSANTPAQNAPVAQDNGQAAQTEAAVTVATEATTTKPLTIEEVAEQFIGYALDDVAKAFSDAKKSHLFSYESDNGKKIIVKNNWAVSDYRISEGKIVFVCTKFRNDGILEAAAENVEGLAAAADLLKLL